MDASSNSYLFWKTNRTPSNSPFALRHLSKRSQSYAPKTNDEPYDLARSARRSTFQERHSRNLPNVLKGLASGTPTTLYLFVKSTTEGTLVRWPVLAVLPPRAGR